MNWKRNALWSAALLILVSGAVLLGRPGSVVDVAQAADAAAGERPMPQVEYVRPATDTITRVVRVAAEVKPYRETFVYARTSGYAVTDPLEVGTRVDPNGDEGQKVLVKLNVPALDAAVHTARQDTLVAAAGIAQASAAVLESRQAQVQAQAHYQQARGMIKAAEAQADKARATLAYRQIVYDRLTRVLEGSPNLVARDRVDEAEGDVKIGQAELALAEVGIQGARDDASVAEAQIKAAAAQVDAAEASVEVAKAGKELAEARLKEAETMRSFATIDAPFRGVVAERTVDRGDLVYDATRNSGAKSLFRVVDDDRLRIRFFVSTPDAPSCRIGNKVVLRLDELPGEVFEAKVARIADALDPETRTMEVEAELDNPRDAEGRRMLRSDMFARVNVELETYDDAMVLPARCVMTKKRKSSVLVLTPEGIVRKIPVQIGVDDGLRIQILSGIEGSTQVISKGGGLVADGEKAVGTQAKEE